VPFPLFVRAARRDSGRILGLSFLVHHRFGNL
jgi:hypothetical protein